MNIKQRSIIPVLCLEDHSHSVVYKRYIQLLYTYAYIYMYYRIEWKCSYNYVYIYMYRAGFLRSSWGNMDSLMKLSPKNNWYIILYIYICIITGVYIIHFSRKPSMITGKLSLFSWMNKRNPMLWCSAESLGWETPQNLDPGSIRNEMTSTLVTIALVEYK